MDYATYNYVDTAVNGPQNRNCVKSIFESKFEGQKDCYRTYFRYPESFAEHVKKTGSVKGYQGFAYADWFPIDIDDDDLEKALNTTRDLLSRIEVNFDIDLMQVPVFFSGAKGFHVYLPAKMMRISPSAHISAIFKAFAKDLLEPWSIRYDPAIYDIVRLLRSNNTINSKTGLYKVPLSIREIFNLEVDGIKGLAIAPRKIDWEDADENETLVAMYARASESINNRPKVNGAVLDADETEVPKNAKLCYYELLKGVSEGGRDLVAYRLATYFRKQGYTADLTEGLMQSWNQRNTPPLPTGIITAKVKSAYDKHARNDFGCNDEVLRKYCSSRCYLKKQKDVAVASIIHSFEEAAASYEQYAKHLQVKSCQIGLPVIGEAMRGIAPGEVCTIIARSGVGKTAMLLNVLMRVAMNNKVPQMFFTMEQPIPQIYERMAQITMKMPGSEVENIYSQVSRINERELIKERTRELFQHTLLVDKDFLSVEQMIELVHMGEEQKVNQKIGIVAIDYLGRMGGKGKDSYAVLSENAQNIKHMAKELNVAVISLAQVNRKGEDGTKELSMDMIRDSGQIEEASDFIIGMWRPEMLDNQMRPDDKLRMRLLKNRKGPAGVTYDLKLIKQCLRVDDYKKSMWLDVAENEKADFAFFGRVIEYA